MPHSMFALALLVGVAVNPAQVASQKSDPMAVAASALLESLDKEQRAVCVYEFDHAERRHWQPIPFGEAGVRLDKMTEPQRGKVRALLSSALSKAGVATVDGVLLLEKILVALAAERGRPSRVLAVDRYFVTVYGDPRASVPWGWRIEGHHLSMTFTCKNGEWMAHGPIFVGAQPARVKGGAHDGMRLLGTTDDNVRSFLESLDTKQRAKAVADDKLPGNILLMPGKDKGFSQPRGLAGADLTPAQRAALFDILSDWADWLRVDLAGAERKRMKSGLDQTRFFWLGGIGVDEPHYWRIVGPHFAIEYAAPERDPDHVHALWRDIENDFGGALLRRHLDEHHSER